MDKVSSYKEGIYKYASNKKSYTYDPYKTTKTVAINNAFDNALDMVVDIGTMTGGVLIGAGAAKKKGFANKINAAKKALSSKQGRSAFKSFGNQQILAVPIGLGITGAYTGLSYLRDKKDAERINKRKRGIYKKANIDLDSLDMSSIQATPEIMLAKMGIGKALLNRVGEQRAKDELGRDIFDKVLQQQDLGRY